MPKAVPINKYTRGRHSVFTPDLDLHFSTSDRSLKIQEIKEM